MQEPPGDQGHWGPVRLWQGGVAPGSFQAIGANSGRWKERAPGEGHPVCYLTLGVITCACDKCDLSRLSCQLMMEGLVFQVTQGEVRSLSGMGAPGPPCSAASALGIGGCLSVSAELEPRGPPASALQGCGETPGRTLGLGALKSLWNLR